MGLRQPGDLLRQNRQQGVRTPAFRANPGSSQIDPTFLGTIDKARQAAAKRDEAAEKKKRQFMKALFENDADMARVRAETDLANSKGINALEEAPSIKEQYIGQLKERLQKMPESYRNDPDIQLSYIKKAGQFEKFAVPYTNSEARRVEEEAFSSRIANDMNTVVENATDLDYIEVEGIPTVESAIHQKLIREYGEDPNRPIGNTTAGEIMVSEMQAGVSDTLRKAIIQQVNVEDFDTAAQTVERFYDRITPDDRTKVMKIINRGLKDREDDRALGLTETAWRALGNDADMVQVEEFIRAASGGDSDTYSKAMQFARMQSTIKEQQEEKRIEDLKSDIYNNVVRGGSLDENKLSQLPPDERTSLVNLINKNGGREATVTDFGMLTEIHKKWDDMPSEEILEIDVNKRYGMHLNSEDRRALMTRQDHVRKQVNREFRDGQKWNSKIPREAAQTYARANGLRGSSAGNVEALAIQEYERIITENPRITQRELNIRLRKAIWERASRQEEDPTIFQSIKRFFGSDSEVRMRETPAETLAPERGAAATAAHPSWIRSVQEDRIKRGQRPMGDDELNRFFEWLQYTRPNINVSAPKP